MRGISDAVEAVSRVGGMLDKPVRTIYLKLFSACVCVRARACAKKKGGPPKHFFLDGALANLSHGAQDFLSKMAEVVLLSH